MKYFIASIAVVSLMGCVSLPTGYDASLTMKIAEQTYAVRQTLPLCSNQSAMVFASDKIASQSDFLAWTSKYTAPDLHEALAIVNANAKELASAYKQSTAPSDRYCVTKIEILAASYTKILEVAGKKTR